MDGVLVDFIKGYEKLTGIDITGTHHNSDNFWDPINQAGYDFWNELEWERDGKTLWNYIKKHNPTILSAPSKYDNSRVAKHDWVKRELPGTELILKYSKNKKELATPNSLLIDDRPENINDWVEAGGIGILHTSATDTINQLKKLKL